MICINESQSYTIDKFAILGREIQLENLDRTFVLEEATIGAVHQALTEGRLTCRQLIEGYLDRIERLDRSGPKINSVININPNALAEADELDRTMRESGLVGPLHGIPVLLKDNINTCDMPTTAGSVNLAECVPSEVAAVVKKLKSAGAIILAKMNMHEFAIGGESASSLQGQTLNPYDQTRTPGGSSGGPAAGIAMNFGIVGIGTDTVNSVRSPASACNLVGFRPTYGLVSKAGVIPSSRTQDNVGPLTRTVTDAAIVLDTICGYDPADSSTAWSVGRHCQPLAASLNPDGLKGKRIGIMRSFFGKDEIHEPVNRVMQRCLADLEKAGATVVEVIDEFDAVKLQKEISVDLLEFKVALNSYLCNLGPEAKVHSLSELLEADNYFQGIANSIKTAETLEMNTPDYYERTVKRAQLRDRIMGIMARDRLDAIAFPHQKRPAVKVGESQLERNGILGALTGFPTCVVPGGFTEPDETAPLGIPVGIEFLTREWGEPALLEILYGFEQATRHRRAPVMTI